MSVIDHIRVASTELMKAAELVKQEIEGLRKDETQATQEVHNTIASLTRQVQKNQHEIRAVDDSNIQSKLQSVVARVIKFNKQRQLWQRIGNYAAQHVRMSLLDVFEQ